MEKNKNKIVINAILIIAFISILTFVSIKYGTELTKLASHPDEFKAWILGYGKMGILIFTLFQILQVLIVVIPSEVVQVAGGFLYGVLGGTLYSVIGITVGSLLCFTIGRLLGFGFIRKIIDEKTLKKFDYIINNPKAEIIIFICFLITGLPKDILTYIAGITPMKFLNFFLIALLARFPGILFTSLIGSNIGSKNYIMALVIGAICILSFIFVLFKKDVLMGKLKDLE